MLEFLEGIGSGSVRVFWLPVLIWTGLAGAVALGFGVRDRFGPRPPLVRNRLHPLAGYRLRQALLLALPASILAAPWVPALWSWESELWGPVLSTGLDPAVMPSPRGGVTLPSDPLPAVDIAAVLLGGAMAAVVVVAVTRIAALCVDLQRLRGIRLTALRANDAMPQRMLREIAGQLSVRPRVHLLEGPPDSAPMTFGFRRPVVVVPRTVLDSPTSLRTVLAHELTHVRRADYFWALLESVTGAVFAFHPLAWLLRRGIERCRETSCDAEVVGAGLVRPREYAELLAHTHTPARFPAPAVAASMSGRAVTLKERLEAMKYFADVRLTARRRTGAVAGAVVVFLSIASIAACAGSRDAPAEHDLSSLAALTLDTEKQSYVIPLSIDPEGPVQYTRMSEQEAQEEIERLEIQVQYLRERIEEISKAVKELPEPGPLRFGPDPPDPEWSDRYYLNERLRVLHTVRREVVRTAEKVKLAYETQKRMRGRP